MTAIGLCLLLISGAFSGWNSLNRYRAPDWLAWLMSFTGSLGLGLMLAGVLVALWRWMP